ncbi:tubulointerstitial nephritis antigen-like [Saccostrea echinata]|uniref:tubulointerstitial nephritis antigen-like n=1 Tax=Saccostrea echinata TaxID=191078 RepID=UPI002A7EBA3C|nr:tubulointerstitial nephritis antigen-like [Saccostrea echinata]
MRKLKFPLLFLLVLPFCKGGRYRRFIEWGADLAPGSFCSSRQSSPCCSGRDDNCTVEILGSLCYCDVFCNRASNDCCPDYASTCQGIAPPVTKAGCVFDGKEYKPSEVIRDNCNVCTCSRVQLFRYDWVCSNNSCLIDLERFNKTAQNLGWKTANYTRFWNKTFTDGIKENVGIATESKAQNMSSLQNKVQNDLPAFFDSRKKWKSWIHPVRDQRNCASSWAFSTVDVAADRLAIESKGLLTNQLSPQHLLSCDTRRKQRGCEGGSTEKAWWFIKRKGIMTEECYPYNVTQSNTAANKCLDNMDTCPNTNSSTSKIVLYVTPPYRVGESEEEIKTEIYKSGPVQATFQVSADLFMYRSGVYRHTGADLVQSKLAVRIIGWGEDIDKKGRVRKYWICLNSWGTKWGEEGAFRIVRGENHLGIEENILGVHADMKRSLATHPSEGIRDEGLINIYNQKQIVVIKRPRPTARP